MGPAGPPRARNSPPSSPRITRLDREGQTPLFRLRAGGLADAAAAKALCEAVRARNGACLPSVGGGNGA